MRQEPPLVVREGGVEPPCPFGHTDLNRARLPIPPLARDPPGWEAPQGYRWPEASLCSTSPSPFTQL